jgi:hypothetical protein
MRRFGRSTRARKCGEIVSASALEGTLLAVRNRSLAANVVHKLCLGLTQEGIMGALIPTNPDKEIRDALNIRFSEANDPNAEAANPTPTMIGSVRWHDSQHEHLFDARGLQRVAFRLINNVPADRDSRKRWNFLLRHPTSPAALSHQNRKDIKNALNQAMNDATIRQVKFAADHKNVATRFQVESTKSNELSTADGNRAGSILVGLRPISPQTPPNPLI